MAGHNTRDDVFDDSYLALVDKLSGRAVLIRGMLDGFGQNFDPFKMNMIDIRMFPSEIRIVDLADFEAMQRQSKARPQIVDTPLLTGPDDSGQKIIDR